MPSTLYPLPSTLYPLPYAIGLMPYALCLMPYALCLMPYALYPVGFFVFFADLSSLWRLLTTTNELLPTRGFSPSEDIA